MMAKLNSFPLKEEITLKPGRGGGKGQEYISGGIIIDHLNEVFGFNGWNTEFLDEDVKQMQQPSGHYHVSVFVKCKITLADESFHVDIGSGENKQMDFHHCVDVARKGAHTDALKRTARHFGNYLGNSLYISKESARKCAPATLTERDANIAVTAQKGRDELGLGEKQNAWIKAIADDKIVAYPFTSNVTTVTTPPPSAPIHVSTPIPKPIPKPIPMPPPKSRPPPIPLTQPPPPPPLTQPPPPPPLTQPHTPPVTLGLKRQISPPINPYGQKKRL